MPEKLFENSPICFPKLKECFANPLCLLKFFCSFNLIFALPFPTFLIFVKNYE